MFVCTVYLFQILLSIVLFAGMDMVIIVPGIVDWQDMVTVLVMVTGLVLVMDMEPLEDILQNAQQWVLMAVLLGHKLYLQDLH